jgi:hypothetical protein
MKAVPPLQRDKGKVVNTAKTRHALAVCVLSIALGACCPCPTKKGIEGNASGKVISLEDAISQVQHAIVSAQNKPSDEKIGALVSKVSVVLKVAGTDTKNNTVGGTIGVVLPPVTIGGTASETATAVYATENTITLELTNPLFAGPLFAPKDSVIGPLVLAGDWAKIRSVIEQMGGVLLENPPPNK